MTYVILLLLFVLLANLPWLSTRFLTVLPLSARWAPDASKKPVWLCLLELVLLYFLAGTLAHFAEISLQGQAYPQGWEFYAVTACLFLVFAFPGFVYYFFWRK